MSRFYSLAVATGLAIILGLGGETAVNADGHIPTGDVLQTGSFSGQSGHTVSGEVQLIQSGEVFYLVLGEDFQFDGAPDPRLGFSSNDEFDETSIFSGLNLDSGQQVYRLPATMDVSRFDEVTIWCEKFSAPLAEAKF